MKVSKGSNQKQQRKSGNTIFPIIRSIGVFLRRSRAANSVVGGPIWSKFEHIHNIMHVLVSVMGSEAAVASLFCTSCEIKEYGDPVSTRSFMFC